jgi:hypothetical protein
VGMSLIVAGSVLLLALQPLRCQLSQVQPTSARRSNWPVCRDYDTPY